MTYKAMHLTTLTALILGLVIGICGTMALHVDQPGPDAGDWLGFAGALFGVVFTIVGTLWLERYKATASDRENQKILLDTLDELKNGLARVCAPRGDDAIDVARARRIKDETALLKSLNKFIYARHYVPKRNIEAWQATEDLNETIWKERPILEKEVTLISNAGDNESVLAVNIDIMAQIYGRLSGPLTLATRVVANHQV